MKDRHVEAAIICIFLALCLLLEMAVYSVKSGDAEVSRIRNSPFFELPPNDAEVTRTRNQLFAELFPGNADVSRYRNLALFDMDEADRVDLKVSIWGPQRISPGQTVDYMVEYRNDGLKVANETALCIFPPPGNVISSSLGAVFDRSFGTISWNLSQVLPKSVGVRTFKVQTPWGLPTGTELGASAYIVQVGGENPLQPENLFVNGIGLVWGSEGAEKYEEYARRNNARWVPTYYSENIALDIQQVIMATPGTMTPTDYNGLKQPLITNHSYDTVSAYSGGTRTVVTAITHYGLRCRKLVLISPISGFQLPNSEIAFKRELDELLQLYDVEEIEIYQSAKDQLPFGGIYQIHFDPNDPWLNGKNIKVTEEPLPGCPDPASLPFLERVKAGIRAHWELFWVVNSKITGINAAHSSAVAAVVTACDPNIKFGPKSYVLPGQILNYTVGYENEGEGIAFGVYITDTLPPELNASTLVVGEDGAYDPWTRTVTWLIGEVGSNENGTVTYSVKVNMNASVGDEIVNYATVHFPSVPETTRTNAVVNTVSSEHNIAALFVTPSKTLMKKGDSLALNVTVENRGLSSETFNVTVFANTTIIQTKTVTLAEGNYTVVFFSWNTSSCNYGNYLIRAAADAVQGETQISDNEVAGGIVQIEIPGNVNYDQKVDLKDVYAVAKAYGSERNETGGQYCHIPTRSCCPHMPSCDVSNDGKIDLKDYFTTCKNYGKSW